jgi:hypothetical protein
MLGKCLFVRQRCGQVIHEYFTSSTENERVHALIHRDLAHLGPWHPDRECNFQSVSGLLPEVNQVKCPFRDECKKQFVSQ